MGFSRMERMADIEERYGFRSSWNLPLAQYPIDWKAVERLRARGFEFGAHGLAHDGRMFRSRHDFEVCKMLVERLAGEHDLRGFRGPSTLRNAEWIGTMSFEYDSTFSDTDPYEPQPGGTCSLFPFFLSEMVELPYTLPQDHTLIHLVRRNPLSTWVTKAHWIQSLGGMILTLTHPDYTGDDENLPMYEELLKVLSDFNAWRALPCEVAQWWRERAQMKLTIKEGKPSIEGLGARRAIARRVSEESFAG
jgi:peptidoglycan/xylan/chitin deacetylase (PgdA/CDA1 family)